MHFGCICDNGASHVMSCAAIGRALERRGHRFTLLALPHLRPWIEREGISAFYLAPYIEASDRTESVATSQQISPQQIVQGLVRDAEYLHRELPPALLSQGIECLLVDANLPAGCSIAEAAGLPFVTYCCALPPHEEPGLPPGFLPWPYKTGLLRRLRNISAYRIRDYLVRPLLRELNSFRQRHGLALYRGLSDALSPFAQITQLVAEFDLPRTQLPACFHYVGPYVRRDDGAIQFPFERLDGRPLVYAAMGTVLGTSAKVWSAIAQACAPLDVQLVIALGIRQIVAPLPDLPGNPVVVGYAPQEALLARAALFINHAGLNSALEGLAHGVPLLAMPFVADQMGVASRIVFRGVGRSVGPERKHPEVLRRVATELLADTACRDRCQVMAQALQASGGADLAARIIERVGLTRQPVCEVPL